MTRLGVGIQVEGLEDLNRRLQDLSKGLGPDVVEPILLKGAESIADAVRQRTPIGPTGNLRRSITAKTLRRHGFSAAPSLAAINFKLGPHAHLLEFGTVKMKARPFFQPTAESKLPEVSEQIINDLLRVTEENWNK